MSVRPIAELINDPRIPFADKGAIAMLLLMDRLEQDVQHQLSRYTAATPGEKQREKQALGSMLTRRTAKYDEMLNTIERELERERRKARP